MNLENQTAVVMGGSSGMGRATVQRLAASGARVIATARNRDKLENALRGLGERVVSEVCDSRDRAALDGFFTRTGPFDHLVLALSGGEGGGEFAHLDLGALRRGFEAKFWPQVQAAQAALPSLRRGGSITFITAISARIANPGTAGLAAINSAIESMIGALARELKPSRVNAVSPGVVDTPWWDQFPAEQKAHIFKQQAEALPVGRVGEAGDIAHAVQFLIENSFMTGTVIECDGGLHLL
jgi:NAD(P)-dependent dehydrogenase (short-subunit alcohol dehydrogenase family)